MKNKYIARSHLSEPVFRQVVKLFAVDVPAQTAAELLPCSRQAVQRVYSLLREQIVELAVEEARPLLGEIEIDESYFGPRRVRGIRGRGARGKVPVLGLHKRGGRVFVSVVKDCSKRALMPVIEGRILTDSDIYTDGWRAYDGLVTAGYRHHRVHHSHNEFARGRSHINGIESFWSYAKHRIAKLRGVRRDRFLLHLKECEWRFNHRHDDIYLTLLKNLRSRPLLS